MRFRFLNIPVTIQPTFWLFVLIFSFDFNADPIKMLLLATILGFSLLFHEYGHGLAALKFGRNPEITLEAFGGYASYPGAGLSDKQHFIITLCGPVFTGLLIAISYYLLETHLFTTYWPNYFLYCLMKLNTYWLLVNLAPLDPLDGGKIASHLLRKFLGDNRGEWVSLTLGNFTALIGAIYFLFHQNFVFALLFISYGIKNFQAYQSHPSKRKPNAFAQLNEAARMLAEGELDKAQAMFRKLIRSKDDYIQNHSLEGLANVLELQGKKSEAYKLLISIDQNRLTEGKWLLSKLAYQEQNFRLVTALSHEVYAVRPTFETALMNAKAFSQIGDCNLALGWLNTAMQFDQAKSFSVDAIISDSAFDLTRSHLKNILV